MSGANSQPAPQPMYTVQQIELIRRLRNSGLTKEQVVQAFESFEKVDTELGDMYNVPVFSASAATAAPPAQHQQNPAVVRNKTLPIVRIPDKNVAARLAVWSLLSQQAVSPSAKGPRAASSGQTALASSSTSPGASEGQAPSTPQPADAEADAPVHVNRRFPSATRRLPEVVVKQEPGEPFEGGGDGDGDGGASQDASSAGSLDPVEAGCIEVDEFIQKGTEKMHEEIREFLFAHPALQHSEIAEQAGVDVSSVSKFLIGSFSGLSPEHLWRMSFWFLAIRRKLQGQQQKQLGSFPPISIGRMLEDGNNSSSFFIDMGMELRPEMSNGMIEQDGLAVNFTPRRERFTFRTQHLEVLEPYFKTKQYPTMEERSDIATRCNEIMEKVCGRVLGEKEQMQPHNVAYWFSNRRKDIKRMAREGGIEMSSVVLPSKVKQVGPSQPVSAFLVDKDTAVLNPMCMPQTFVTNSYPMSMGASSFLAAAENAAIESLLPTNFPRNMGTFTAATVGHNTPSMTGSAVNSGAVSDSAKESVTDSTESVGVKQVLSELGSSNGGRSVVDRIASAISSHLMSKPGDTEAIPLSPVTVTADSQWP